MKVKALRNFRDLKEKKNRTIGEVFEVSSDRYKELIATMHGILVEEVKEEVGDLTVAQLKNRLDQMGVKYNSKAKKEELIDLIEVGD